MEQQLDQAQRLAEMYREQVISLEERLSRIREKEDVSKEVFKVRYFTKRIQFFIPKLDRVCGIFYAYHSGYCSDLFLF